ncbi:MAG: hypothetical protein V4510_06865 [bacterium]
MSSRWVPIPFAFGMLLAATCGCLTPEAPTELRTLRGFHADLVDRDGKRVALTLDGPVTVPWTNGSIVKVYRLFVDLDRPLDPNPIWFLDADLRVVAYWQGCNRDKEEQCTRSMRLEWKEAGRPAPYGLGLLLKFRRDGALVDASGRPPVALDAHEVAVNGHPMLDVKRPGPHFFMHDDYVGDYTYAGSDDRLIADHGPGFDVVSYQDGAELGRADYLPLEGQPPPQAAWQGQMFPGEGEKALGSRFTALEWLDKLKSSDTAKGVDWSKACIWIADLSAPYVSTVGLTPLLIPYNTTHEGATFTVLEDDNFSATYQIKWMQDDTPLSQPQIEVTRSAAHKVAADGMTCGQIRASPWPAASLPDVLADFARLGLPGQDDVARVSVLYGFPQFYAPRDPASGWAEYQVSFKSAGGNSFILAYVGFDANTGAMDSYFGPSSAWPGFNQPAPP